MDKNGTAGIFGNDWLGAFLIIAILFGGGNGFGFNNRGQYGPDVSEVVNNAVNNQTAVLGQQQILLSSANNNYENARLTSEQTSTLMQQNNTNLINAIQGFNQANINMMNGFNAIGQKLDQLGYQMSQCCCEIKTQMLQDRLDDAQRKLVEKETEISNNKQSQYLLAVMGKWIANPAATAA
jgi:hypothetical protein